jgi:hypothetical protein
LARLGRRTDQRAHPLAGPPGPVWSAAAPPHQICPTPATQGLQSPR